MDPNGDFDVDPDIAAAMGFGGFGSQTKGKRKFDTNDGFVDNSKASATGANSLPMRDHKVARTFENAEAGNPDAQKSSAPESYDPKTQESPALDKLRHGVRNPQGDMIYFLPNFLEDPWARLKAR